MLYIFLNNLNMNNNENEINNNLLEQYLIKMLLFTLIVK